MTAKRHSFYGRRLFQAWVLVASVYACAATVFSIAPIRSAILAAPSATTAAAAPNLGAHKTEVAKIAARQAAIVVVPPLLLLWFGWDVWFALVGFFGRDTDENDAA